MAPLAGVAEPWSPDIALPICPWRRRLNWHRACWRTTWPQVKGRWPAQGSPLLRLVPSVSGKGPTARARMSSKGGARVP